MIVGYPKLVVIRDGTRVTLRPMVPEDGEKLKEFFRGISEVDRWCLKEDVADPRVIEGWAQQLNYERVLPIVAEVDDKIVGDATLHQRSFGGTKHVAKVRVVVAPEYRDKGLGTWMILDLMNLAMQLGLEKLVAEVVVERQDAALEAFSRLGFAKEAVLPNFAKDADGRTYDQAILVRSFHPDWGRF